MGGAEEYAISLAKWFNSTGHNVEVWGTSVSGVGAPLTGDQPLRYLPNSKIHPLYSYALRLRSALRRRAASLSVVQDFDINMLSAVAVSGSRGLAPVVLRIEREFMPHIRQLSSIRTPGLAAWSSRQIAEADHYIANTKGAVDEAISWGIDESRVSYLANGLDTEEWAPGGSESGDAARNELGIPLDAPVASCVARLRPEKGHSRLIKAWSILVSSMPNARLYVLGDGPCLEEVSRSIETQGLQRNVFCIGHTDKVNSYLRASDISVLLSHQEGPALAVQQSLSCATPALVTSVGGLLDTVEDGVDGWRVESCEETPSLAAELLHKVLADPSLLADARIRARNKAKRLWDHHVITRQYSEILHEVRDRWETVRAGGSSR